MTIKNWPKGYGPRERLLVKGAEHLTDAEVIALLIGSGRKGLSAVDIGHNLLTTFSGINGVKRACAKHVQALAGVGPAKYAVICAAFELCRRASLEQIVDMQAITNPSQTKAFVLQQLSHLDREVFALILLDNQHRVIDFEQVFKGTINAAAVYPREVVKIVLEKQAAALILVHNHPSGLAEPSQSDRGITERLIQALKSIDVQVLDHLVVGHQHVVSFAERGWI
ncbi:RadC family protein [Paraferrimonas haliotis]|uniref:UPF0758 protein n=1 Tax=Paraferrimonas haliotis TaxID=2013866 RepID=A0AA37WXZ6_9GAMM|nr:DNA repair protein RadC [Paraferrimonas haliotis]GLS84918.1 UPF0758 protein [Paraferrimonas haliotis]